MTLHPFARRRQRRSAIPRNHNSPQRALRVGAVEFATLCVVEPTGEAPPERRLADQALQEASIRHAAGG